MKGTFDSTNLALRCMQSLTLRLVSPTQKRKLTVQLPTQWNELTFGQLRALAKAPPTELGMLCALSGFPQELWSAARAQGLMEQIEPLLARFAEPFEWNKLPRPATLSLNGATLVPPSDLEQETFGQRLAIGRLLREGIGQQALEPMALALAIYLEPLVSGQPYEESRALAFLSEVDKLNAAEAYPWGAFFLTRPKHKPSVGWRRFITRRVRKSRQRGWKSSIALAISRWSIGWPKATQPSTKRS